LSPAHDQEYFCDGIAEEIINALCCVRDLHVASRTSSFQFKGRQADVREIGRNLGVGAVLEGSVRKSGERIRIAAQLVNSVDGYHHWSESFDRRLDDVFDIQTEIARQLVRALRLTLTPLESALLGRGGTSNAEAYDLYLRGQALLRDGTDTTLPQAALLFRQAIERDPGFAQALAGLANALAIKGVWRLDLTEAEFEEAFSASRRALELQPHMPEAHVASACLLSMQGRAPEATLEFEAALRLNPASFEANYMHARHCFAQGEAEQARHLFEAAHRLRPEDYQPLCMLQGTLDQLGLESEARSAGERAMAAIEARLKTDPQDGRALQLGAVQAAKLGDAARARDLAEKAMLARPGSFATAYNLACAFAVLDERDRAVEYLDAAVRYGRGNLGWIEHDADFRSLRGEPRFEAIVNRLRKAARPQGAAR
jgi:TolB-like protein/Flp pilus assembly protein TadD